MTRTKMTIRRESHFATACRHRAQRDYYRLSAASIVPQYRSNLDDEIELQVAALIRDADTVVDAQDAATGTVVEAAAEVPTNAAPAVNARRNKKRR